MIHQPGINPDGQNENDIETNYPYQEEVIEQEYSRPTENIIEII